MFVIMMTAHLLIGYLLNNVHPLQQFRPSCMCYSAIITLLFQYGLLYTLTLHGLFQLLTDNTLAILFSNNNKL